MLATIADNLDFKTLCQCADLLADQGSIADSNYTSYHHVSGCFHDSATHPSHVIWLLSQGYHYDWCSDG